MDPRLSLSWDSYQKSICNGFSFLQQKGEFVDMTIAADGHHVKVHQIMMSLVSPYIKDLITSAQCPHPIIFLNRVSHETLQLILEYVYTGEVLVPRDNLHQFLEACSVLHIKGLEDECIKSTADRAMLRKTSNKSHIREASTQPATSRKEQRPLDFEQQIDRHNKQNAETDMDYTIDNSDTDGDTKLDVLEKGGGSKQLESSKKQQQTPAPATTMQYSLTCQGSIMIILNRYLYRLRYSRKNERKKWCCADYFRKKCPAYVITKGDTVLERGCAHSHPFHDRQIVKRLQQGNVFAHFNAAQSVAALSARPGARAIQGEDSAED